MNHLAGRWQDRVRAIPRLQAHTAAAGKRALWAIRSMTWLGCACCMCVKLFSVQVHNLSRYGKLLLLCLS